MPAFVSVDATLLPTVAAAHTYSYPKHNIIPVPDTYIPSAGTYYSTRIRTKTLTTKLTGVLLTPHGPIWLCPNSFRIFIVGTIDSEHLNLYTNSSIVCQVVE